MKRFFSFTPEIFCVIFLLVRYIGGADDKLVLYHSELIAAVIASLFLVMFVCLLKFGQAPGLFGSICCWLLPFLAGRALFFLLLQTVDARPPRIVFGISALIVLFLSAMLVLFYGRFLAAKIVTLLLIALPDLVLGLLIFLSILFAGWEFGETTVLQSKPSPNGAYEAQIIEYDQGALGWDFYIRVDTAQEPHNVLYEKISDGHSHTLYWADDQTLIVDGTTYEIP